MHYCTLRVRVYSLYGLLIESHPPPRCYAHLLVLRTSSVINVYSLDFKIFKFFSTELLYSTRKCVQFVGGVDRIPPTTQVLRTFTGASHQQSGRCVATFYISLYEYFFSRMKCTITVQVQKNIHRKFNFAVHVLKKNRQ